MIRPWAFMRWNTMCCTGPPVFSKVGEVLRQALGAEAVAELHPEGLVEVALDLFPAVRPLSHFLAGGTDGKEPAKLKEVGDFMARLRFMI